MGGNVRKAVADGRGDAIPIFLSEIPLLFYKEIIKPDIAVIQVSESLFLVIDVSPPPRIFKKSTSISLEK